MSRDSGILTQTVPIHTTRLMEYGSGLSTVAPRYIDLSTITLVCGRVFSLKVHLGIGGGEENESGGDDRKQ